MSLTILKEDEFTSFIEKCKEHSFMQTVSMSNLLKKRGFETKYLGWKSNKEITVAAIAFMKHLTGGVRIEINSGPSYTNESDLKSFYHELQLFAKKQGALELVVKPDDIYQTFEIDGKPIEPEKTELISTLTDLGYKFDGLQVGYPEGEPTWHYLKNLEGFDEKSLLKSFNKNSIRNIKTALDYNVIVRKINKGEIPEFKKIIEETGRRQGFEDKSLDYYTDLHDAFGDNADFLVAELDFEKSLDHINSKLTSLNPKSKQYEQQAQKLNKQKQIISELKQKINTEKILLACALILYTQDQATYLFGGSYTEFQKFSAAFLIQYHAMNCTLRRNIMSYNFLGITGVFDGSDGVLRFKQNFNGYIVRKMGTFRYYPQPLKYKLIQGLKKLLRRS